MVRWLMAGEVRRGRLLAFLALVVVLCASCTQPRIPARFNASVVGVIDGDTIEVIAIHQSVRIRLWGIDCPERGQAFSTQAKKLTSRLAYGKRVKVLVKDTDRYGRTVAVVTLSDGKQLNRELVRAGMAWWYRKYAPNDRELATLERSARKKKVGVWSQPSPVPPWEFRADERSTGG